LDLIKRLIADQQLQDFNLVGGTALSLKMGHRKSIDIDLFSLNDFNAQELAGHLADKYMVENIRVLKNGIFCFIENVKVDLIAHQYPLANPVETIDGIRMVSLEDIGAMKLHAIVQNGRRLKDFVDIYALLEYKPLKIFYDTYEFKYPDSKWQMAQSGLLYHEEIDFTIPVTMQGGEMKWQVIATRLKEAVLQTQKVFPSQRREDARINAKSEEYKQKGMEETKEKKKGKKL